MIFELKIEDWRFERIEDWRFFLIEDFSNGMIYNSCFVKEKKEKDFHNNNKKDKIETKIQEEEGWMRI